MGGNTVDITEEDDTSVKSTVLGLRQDTAPTSIIDTVTIEQSHAQETLSDIETDIFHDVDQEPTYSTTSDETPVQTKEDTTYSHVAETTNEREEDSEFHDAQCNDAPPAEEPQFFFDCLNAKEAYTTLLHASKNGYQDIGHETIEYIDHDTTPSKVTYKHTISKGMTHQYTSEDGSIFTSVQLQISSEFIPELYNDEDDSSDDTGTETRRTRNTSKKQIRRATRRPRTSPGYQLPETFHECIQNDAVADEIMAHIPDENVTIPSLRRCDRLRDKRSFPDDTIPANSQETIVNKRSRRNRAKLHV